MDEVSHGKGGFKARFGGLYFCPSLRVFTRFPIPFLAVALALAWVTGCRTSQPISNPAPSTFTRFVGLDHFDEFQKSPPSTSGCVWLSPVIHAGTAWNELIISWNLLTETGTPWRVEASALTATGPTRFYNLGDWSPGPWSLNRTSHPGQKDAVGRVATDTLVLREPAEAVQLRLTTSRNANLAEALQYLGLCFTETQARPRSGSADHRAWGKTLDVPEFSQHGWPGAHGWCSPTSVAMVLGYWSRQLQRPELSVTVPQVAAAVYDQSYHGTGNWPFNLAYAGSFPGLRGILTRFDDLNEVEEWIDAGVPVILSTRWDQLKPGRPTDADGHLIVCVGFTREGNVIVNDPATPAGHPEKGRQIYQRADVLRSWEQSHHAVYLIYPKNFNIPNDAHHHW